MLSDCKCVLSLCLTVLKRTFKNTFLQPTWYDQWIVIIKSMGLFILITLPLCLTGLSPCLDTENTIPEISFLDPDQNEPEKLNTCRFIFWYILSWFWFHFLLIISYLEFFNTMSARVIYTKHMKFKLQRSFCGEWFAKCVN